MHLLLFDVFLFFYIKDHFFLNFYKASEMFEIEKSKLLFLH